MPYTPHLAAAFAILHIPSAAYVSLWSCSATTCSLCLVFSPPCIVAKPCMAQSHATFCRLAWHRKSGGLIEQFITERSMYRRRSRLLCPPSFLPLTFISAFFPPSDVSSCLPPPLMCPRMYYRRRLSPSSACLPSASSPVLIVSPFGLPHACMRCKSPLLCVRVITAIIAQQSKVKMCAYPPPPDVQKAIYTNLSRRYYIIRDGASSTAGATESDSPLTGVPNRSRA